MPSSTEGHAGTVSIGSTIVNFTSVEPLVVHGLPDFKTATPDANANLDVDSINVDDMNLTNLALHTVTVDGVAVPQASCPRCPEGWTYFPVTNSIFFGDTVTPAKGARIEVTYSTKCL